MGSSRSRMKYLGKEVLSTDIIDRTNGLINEKVDFLNYNKLKSLHIGTDIITNPPYKFATECVEKAIDLISDGHKVAMFLKIQFLEGQNRRKLFDKYPPKIVAVFSKRIKCAINGDFENIGSSASCYAWFIWEKGYKGETIIKWI